MSKTVKLREALISRGYKPVPHPSDWECLEGKTKSGTPLWIWLNKTGGARYNYQPKKGTAIPISQTTIGKILQGQPSALVSDVQVGVAQ